MSHTPGPWRVDDRGSLWSPKFASPLARDVYIDCRPLIATAPEMLDALYVARSAIELLNALATPKQEIAGTLAEINAAIAKAEGK